MNWNEYKTLAIRTESVPRNTFGALDTADTPGYVIEERNEAATRLLHATMGVCTELAELIDGSGKVNFVEETGDVLWYLAIADDVISWNGAPVPRANKPPIYWLGELNDVLKRHLFYGKDLDIQRLATAFCNIFLDLLDTLNGQGFTVEQAMEANIRKLEKRFPEKMFTAQAAIHRDVDRELDHILLNGELVPKVETLLELETDEQLAEVVKERQGQPTVPVNLDCIAGMEDFLEAVDWAELITSHLTSTQISCMGMDLCCDRANGLRAIGAELEARAYDAIYRMCGSSLNLFEDRSIYNIWMTLGYSPIRKDVVERLERWK